MNNPYQVGDPVMDAAQGRAMIVLGVPNQTVAEWSNDNGYDLLENYANAKFDPSPNEGVVRCAYLGNVRSDPSKDYTFPVSRVRLIDAHHADDGDRIADRIADRVAVDVLSAVFGAALDSDEIDAVDVQDLCAKSDIDRDLWGWLRKSPAPNG